MNELSILVPTLRVGTHVSPLRGAEPCDDLALAHRRVTQSVRGCVPTRSVGTRRY